MGLTFYGANRREEIMLSTPCTDLPTEVAEFLYARRAACPEQAAFFWELDPYGDAEFSGEALEALAQRCTALLKFPWDVRWEEDTVAFTAFLQELRALCTAAMDRGGTVIMLGD